MIAEKGDEFFMGYENFGRVMAKRTKSGLIGKGNGKGRDYDHCLWSKGGCLRKDRS